MNERHRNAVGFIAVAFAASSWGTWPLIVRTISKTGTVSPSLFSAVLMLVMTVASFPVALLTRTKVKASLFEWGLLAWLGVADALNVFCFFAAYKHTTVAIAVLTHYLTPLFVALLAPLVLRDRFQRSAWGFALVALVGLGLLLRPWSQSFSAADARGACFGAASAVFYASNVLVNKRISKVFSAGELMFLHGLVATPLLLLMVPSASWTEASPTALSWVALASLGPGAMSGILFVWGLAKIPAATAASLTYLEPLVAVLVGATLLGESMPPIALLGAVLVLGSTYGALRTSPA